ncbi:hypothetical protein [Sphingomonas sp.]|uniref:hypothetical protein n=1 Tax=Sphingomonas sp. TaxID=28214 RepID=UPI003CC6D9C8
MKTAPIVAAVMVVAGLAGCTDSYGPDRYAVGYGVGYHSYWGWYGDYYYPGTGVYVYDRYRRAHRWDDGQRRYWEGRRTGGRGRSDRANWDGFAGTNAYRYDERTDRGAPPRYVDRGYRTHAAVAVPQDAQPPAYRSGAPEGPVHGHDDRHHSDPRRGGHQRDHR